MKTDYWRKKRNKREEKTSLQEDETIPRMKEWKRNRNRKCRIKRKSAANKRRKKTISPKKNKNDV